jgi:hypothetical protein
MDIHIRMSRQKDKFQYSWRLSAITTFKLLLYANQKKNQILDLQDFTVISALYMKILIFGLSWL